MNRSCIWIALGSLLLAAVPGHAAAAPAHPPAVPPTKQGARTTAVTRAHSAADTRSRARPRVGTRMLDDIHIEGEIPVPQVLFITARDQRRFMDFQHHRYLESSARLGEDTPFPTWAAVIHGMPRSFRLFEPGDLTEHVLTTEKYLERLTGLRVHIETADMSPLPPKADEHI